MHPNQPRSPTVPSSQATAQPFKVFHIRASFPRESEHLVLHIVTGGLLASDFHYKPAGTGIANGSDASRWVSWADGGARFSGRRGAGISRRALAGIASWRGTATE